MRDDFAVFILTHGRARQQKTLATLKKCGYTGKLFLVIDDEFETMCKVMDDGRIAIFGFSQAGAFIGGVNDRYLRGHQRKVSQAMLYDAENPISFRGLFYEDLLVALDAGIDGRVAISTMLVSIQSPKLASNAGGMNSLYKDDGSYAAGFYSVMAYPSVIGLVEEKGEFKLRIKGSAFCPMIIGERWRK